MAINVDQMTAETLRKSTDFLKKLSDIWEEILKTGSEIYRKNYVDTFGNNMHSIIQNELRGGSTNAHIPGSQAEYDYIMHCANKYHLNIVPMTAKNGDDTITYFLYKAQDKAMLQSMLAMFRKDYSQGLTEIDMHDFTIKNENKPVIKFSDLTKVEIEAFRAKAANRQLEFAVDEEENLWIAKENEDIATLCIDEALYETMDKDLKSIYEKITNDKQKLISKSKSGDDFLLVDTANPNHFYYVDTAGKITDCTIKLTANGPVVDSKPLDMQIIDAGKLLYKPTIVETSNFGFIDFKKEPLDIRSDFKNTEHFISGFNTYKTICQNSKDAMFLYYNHMEFNAVKTYKNFTEQEIEMIKAYVENNKIQNKIIIDNNNCIACLELDKTEINNVFDNTIYKNVPSTEKLGIKMRVENSVSEQVMRLYEENTLNIDNLSENIILTDGYFSNTYENAISISKDNVSIYQGDKLCKTYKITNDNKEKINETVLQMAKNMVKPALITENDEQMVSDVIKPTVSDASNSLEALLQKRRNNVNIEERRNGIDIKEFDNINFDKKLTKLDIQAGRSNYGSDYKSISRS